MTESRERTRFLMENPDLIFWGAKRWGIRNQDWEEFRLFVLGESWVRSDSFDSQQAKLVTYSARFIRMCATKWKREKQKEKTCLIFSDLDQDEKRGRFVETIAQPEEVPEEREQMERAQDVVRWALYNATEDTRQFVLAFLFDGWQGSAKVGGVSRQRVYKVLEKFCIEIIDLLRINPPPEGFRNQCTLEDLALMNSKDKEQTK